MKSRGREGNGEGGKGDREGEREGTTLYKRRKKEGRKVHQGEGTGRI